MKPTETIQCKRCKRETPIIEGMNYCIFCGKNLFSKIIVTRHINKTDRFEVLDRQNWRCNICGRNIKFSTEHNFPYPVAHIDHIHPFSQRKSYPNGEALINETSNLQALCPDCNLKKNKKEIN